MLLTDFLTFVKNFLVRKIKEHTLFVLNCKFQLMKLEEECRNVRKEQFRLKESLSRNIKSRDTVVADSVRKKLIASEKHLEKLLKQQHKLNNEQKSRKDKKESAVFWLEIDT